MLVALGPVIRQIVRLRVLVRRGHGHDSDAGCHWCWLTVKDGKIAVTKTAKARIIAVVPEGVVIPDAAKAQKYLEFLEMKERFGD